MDEIREVLLMFLIIITTVNVLPLIESEFLRVIISIVLMIFVVLTLLEIITSESPTKVQSTSKQLQRKSK